ncbi:ROK family transcriptional regulator [Salibacterium aidingense]|uniref:ROK family transcriptional regulator n=1 Tax=Salibacterium aidingense TaxID=384933 RepID=UPI000405A3F5|nr:ROK family transcriptional regulator [Salibacterium aidingense]
MYNPAQKISKDMMKQMNQKLVLRILKEKGSASKSELSKITGLTLPAITDIMTELELYQVIENLGESRIKRGRFPTLFQLKKEVFHVIGVSIRSESIRVGLYNILGETMAYTETALPENTDPETMMERVNEVIQVVIQKYEVGSLNILGIGLGMHGIVNPMEGISVYPPHLQWENVPIRQLLENKTKLPVLVDNDCNSLTLAEYWFGKGENLNSFITINVDYGVGAGIMIDSQLFHGRNYGAGQIGHTIIQDNGPLCSCGNYGCLETLSSELSIAGQARSKIKQGFPSLLKERYTDVNHVTITDIYDAAHNNDKLASNILEEASRYLGIGLSTLANVFNPEKIIITGGILRGKQSVMDPLIESFYTHALKTNVEDFEITTSGLGAKADVLGAATLWVEHVFKGDFPLSKAGKEGIT